MVMDGAPLNLVFSDGVANVRRTGEHRIGGEMVLLLTQNDLQSSRFGGAGQSLANVLAGIGFGPLDLCPMLRGQGCNFPWDPPGCADGECQGDAATCTGFPLTVSFEAIRADHTGLPDICPGPAP